MTKMIKMKLKKGATLQNWTEGIIVMMLFIVVFGGIIIAMNASYSEDYEVVGLDTSGVQEAVNEYQSGLDDKLSGGDVSFIEQVGLTLSTSWDIVSSTLALIWDFLLGGWIRTITTEYMKLPEIVGMVLQSLYFISIGFIILKILFKVRA